MTKYRLEKVGLLGTREKIDIHDALYLDFITPDNQQFRIKLLKGEDGLQISVDAQIIVLPHSANMIYLHTEDWGK